MAWRKVCDGARVVAAATLAVTLAVTMVATMAAAGCSAGSGHPDRSEDSHRLPETGITGIDDAATDALTSRGRASTPSVTSRHPADAGSSSPGPVAGEDRGEDDDADSGGDGVSGPTDPADSRPGGSVATTTATTASRSFPGGNVGARLLATRGWLDGHGRLIVRDLPPDDPALNRTFCDFLFGTPRQVGDEALLPEGVMLDTGSRYRPAEEGGSFVCIYHVDGAPLLALQVTAGPPVDPELPGRPVIASANGLQGVLSYSPEYAGPTLPAAQARAWMRQAAGLASPPPR